MAISLSDILHDRPTITPQIYGYIFPTVPDHQGYIKIGYTDKDDVEERIKEQLGTATISHQTVLVESAMRSDGTCFTDHDIHKILQRKKKPMFKFDSKNEWYKCTVDDVKNAIIELRTGKRIEENRTADFRMRYEQEQAVNNTSAYFTKMWSEEPDTPPKFLWNAKMRFGKTFATYQLAKKMDMKRVLILTFKPAVESAWQEDLTTHIDFEGWQFVSDKEAQYSSTSLDRLYENCDSSKPIVVFGSFQNLLGTNDAGGIKAKNEFIHLEDWDMVVFDEYHFGAWRDSAKKLFAEADEEDTDFDYDKYAENESGNAINESWLPITTKSYLYLSGTPFRALNNGEFIEDQIFNWTYSDEQEAKLSWDEKNGKNPYASLPRMVMLTYKVPESITEVAINEGYDEFDINEFFKAEYGKDDKVENARFVYEDYVQKWVRLIQGDYMPVDGLKLGSDKPPMPFSDATLLNVLTHTLWFLPNVASCYAMKNLLSQRQNNFFDDYEIIVCAGTKAGIGIDALEPVQTAMGDPLKTKTITLSCGKLTTGVTIRPWSGIFMLRNLKSPETYFQAAFRVQSPWEVVASNGEREIVKEECYIFDFALERALRQVSDYSMKLQVNDTSPEKKVGDFINFLPILAFDGAAMNAISAQDVLDITYAGTSATLLAKRWQTALLVHVDNDTLRKLRENDEALTALQNIEGFRALYDNIETIINRSEKIKKAKKDKGDKITQKEKKELSDEEKEVKSLRKQVQENLLKLAARIPAFMYLTDYREQCIKDVITQIEPELFRKVTGLSVKDFDTLCSIGLFDPEKMNQGIFGFRRYENASLSYTGIDMHEGEDVGGWDTVLKKEEYDALYANQKATMVRFEEAIIPQEIQVEVSKTVKPRTVSIVSDNAGKKSPVIKPLVQKDTTYTVSSPRNVDWDSILPKIKNGVIVHHKSFGDGKVVKITTDHKIYVKFASGQKMFVFPDAFVKGFLSVD